MKNLKEFITTTIRKNLNESNNNEIIAYHGTRRNFDKFELFHPGGAIGNPKGIYFTRDKNTAIEYAQDVDGGIDNKSRVIKVSLSIDSPDDGKIINHSYTGEEIVMFNPDKIKILDNNILKNNSNTCNLYLVITYNLNMQNITHYQPKINTKELSDEVLIKQFGNSLSIELLRLIEGCEVKVDLDYYPNQVFYFKNGRYMMTYEIDSETIWLSNPYIWMVFEGEYSLSYFEISILADKVLNKLFNFKIDLVRAGYSGSVIELEKHFINL